jgi:hypothetical protein
VLFTVCLFFLFFRKLRKSWPLARKKKLEENSGPDPLLSSSVKGCSSPSQDWRRQPRRPSSPEEGDIDRRCFSPPALKMLCSVFMCFESVQANFSLDTFGGHIGAFLKTQRHKNIGHKDTNLCLFNKFLHVFYSIFFLYLSTIYCTYLCCL